MNGRLASCQGSFLGWRGEAVNGLISRNRILLVQRNSRRRRVKKGMVQSCKITGNRGSMAGQFAIREMGTMRVVSKRVVGRGGGKLVVMKAVRNAKGQKIDPDRVGVQSSMGEGSFGQVFQVSIRDCWTMDVTLLIIMVYIIN